MFPSSSQPSASTPHRTLVRLAALLVCVVVIATLAAIAMRQSSDGTDGAPAHPSRGRASNIATHVATSTPTPSAPFAFLDQALKATTDRRGYYALTYPESFADGDILNVIVELPAPPTLADAQWDAFVIQRLAWATPDAQPHAGWQVDVSFHVPDGKGPGSWGTHVGMANLKAATAAHLAWTQLTSAQAWQRYDGTLFDPRGLHP